MPTLEILSGAREGETVPIGTQAAVGKDPRADVVISDPGISRRHAEISQRGGAFAVRDLGSANGTYVNFQKLAKDVDTPLKDRDIVFFGRTVVKFWIEAPPPSHGQQNGAAISAAELADILRGTVPVSGLACPHCSRPLEPELRRRHLERERIEAIRRLGLAQMNPSDLENILNQAKARG